MKINFSLLMDRYGLLALFLLASVFERSLSPLLVLPALLRQKQSQDLLSARVTALESKVENSSQTIQSLGHRLQKQKRQQAKQQEQIQKQQTRQKDLLSQVKKLENRIGKLEPQLDSLQQTLPSKVVPMQRQTLLAIDSANLDAAARTLGVKIDYERLKRYVNSRFGSLEARIYVGEYADRLKQQAWFKYLRHYGYAIVTKEAILHGSKLKANVDVDLAVDVTFDGFNFKNVVLCSGDGDFLPLVKKLQEGGIKVIVLNLPGQTHRVLRKMADEYVDLSEIAADIGYPQGA